MEEEVANERGKSRPVVHARNSASLIISTYQVCE